MLEGFEIALILFGVLGAAGGTIATALVMAAKSDNRRREELVWRAKTPIGEVRDGEEVTILGTARAEPPGQLLAAPTSNRPCIAWWQSKLVPSSDMGWRMVTKGCGRFKVQDDTGEAFVFADDTVLLYLDPATKHRTPAAIEHVLVEGSPVAVAGIARVSGSDATGYAVCGASKSTSAARSARSWCRTAPAT